MYYGQSFGTISRTMQLRFTKEKKHDRLPKPSENFTYNGKTYGNIPKQLKFLDKFIALEP